MKQAYLNRWTREELDHKCPVWSRKDNHSKRIVLVACLALFLLAVLSLPTRDCHASILGPDKDTVKQWLFNKKVVVGKRLGVLDRTEIINIFNVKAIRIVDYKEEFDVWPYTKNYGTVWVEFTYTTEGEERKYLATFTYTWQPGTTEKARYLKDVKIESK